MCADGVLEIQLMSEDASDWEPSCRRYLETGLLRRLVVHLPIPNCQIAFVYLRPDLRSAFEELCRSCAALSERFGTALSLLFHCDGDYRYLLYSGCVDWLRELIRAYPGLEFLVENIFPDSNSLLGERRYMAAPFLDLIDEIDRPNLRFCFDLCHYEAGVSIFRGDYALPRRLFTDYTRYIHFNRSLDGDGYRSHATHSCRHEDRRSCEAALALLAELGIPLEQSLLTLEISETDYTARPNLAAEYEMLRSIRADMEKGT